MNEINIDFTLGFLQKKLGELCDKHFVAKQELSENEQNLLNDMYILLMHSIHKENIRKHFSTKK